MEAITNDAVTTAPTIVWKYCQKTQLLVSNPQKLVSCADPSVEMEYSTRSCIHASVATMKNPEIHEPINTKTAERKWTCLPNFFSPKRNSPRKLDSRKNAKTPSIASVCPITPPANRENAAQFVPNWNSIGIPVTTPTAKLSANIFPQNRAASL